MMSVGAGLGTSICVGGAEVEVGGPGVAETDGVMEGVNVIEGAGVSEAELGDGIAVQAATQNTSRRAQSLFIVPAGLNGKLMIQLF